MPQRIGRNGNAARRFGAFALLSIVGGNADAVVFGKLQLNGEPGEPLVGNTSIVLDVDSDSVSAYRIDNRLYVNNSSSPGPSWGLTLTNPKYPNAPRVGCHERARRDAFVPNRPGLDFTFNSSGCNAVLGRYRIRELLINPADNRIVRLAVDFVQHCEGMPAALFGKLRLYSSVPLTTPPLERVFVTEGRLDVVSPPGEPLGGGQNRTYVFDHSRFRAWGNYTFSSPPLSSLEIYHGASPSQEDYWSLQLMRRDHQPLVAGLYPDARDIAFGDPARPGMSLGFQNYVCGSALRGQFDVLAHERDRIDGLSTRLSAHLTQQCTVDYPALEAQLDYTTTIRAGALADDVIFLDGLDPDRNWPLSWNCP
jgi:hypothetical protein